ncbi:NADH dehydrogenase [ubiquinone] 1 alpha subcomplex assembly factor 2-like [Asterias amurensis]|uniref:NADH dehydrogenase [ubiquinone] 1 alpha subcomplex assembly factor 2-like n=1 Tax=Asterias amurensis TaxID=7602 RepID=UPI003AB60219
MNFIRGIFRLGRSSKILVGTDHLGNKYFEIPERSTITTKEGLLKARRICEAKYSHADYEEGMIPIEWEAWVRGKRNDPPSHEEIMRREQMTVIVKKRAKELEAKDQEKQLQDYKEGLVAEPAQTKQIGHASAPVFEATESGQSVSTGNEYEPAAWQPGQSSSKVK